MVFAEPIPLAWKLMSAAGNRFQAVRQRPHRLPNADFAGASEGVPLSRQESTLMTPGLFRKQAVERVSSPEQLDQLIRVTSPRSWLALLSLVGLLVLALAWGWFGRIPVGISGAGMLLGRGGINIVVATGPGQLASLEVGMGDAVQAGDVVAYLQPLDSSQRLQEVRSPYSGHVVETLVAPGDLVGLGSPLLTLASVEDGLQAVLYVPLNPGHLIHPGMEVRISLEGLRKEQTGYLAGTVRSVGEYPVSLLRARRTVGSEETARRLLGDDPVLETWVDLVPDPATPSGYRWSLAPGPPIPLAPGIVVQGMVVVAYQRPLSLLLPGWSR